MTNLPANADTAIVAEKYRAVADYEPQHHDEIKLTTGNQIIVLHSYDDGTYFPHTVVSLCCVSLDKLTGLFEQVGFLVKMRRQTLLGSCPEISWLLLVLR